MYSILAWRHEILVRHQVFREQLCRKDSHSINEINYQDEYSKQFFIIRHVQGRIMRLTENNVMGAQNGTHIESAETSENPSPSDRFKERFLPDDRMSIPGVDLDPVLAHIKSTEWWSVYEPFDPPSAPEGLIKEMLCLAPDVACKAFIIGMIVQRSALVLNTRVR